MSQLCALEDVKTYLGLTGGTSDVVLAPLITNVSALIENFCNRVFAQAPYTETMNGNGGYRLMLGNAPVSAVASVTVDGLAITQAANATDSGYVFDDDTVYIRGCQRFNRGVQNVTVAYTAGFATIPQDVNQACVEWVADKYGKRNRIDKKSETLGTQQTQAYDLSDMPESVRSALLSYVRWVP